MRPILMLLGRCTLLVVGRSALLFGAYALLMVGGCSTDALTGLGGLLSEGSTTATSSHSDSRFDGGSVLLVEARYPGTVSEVLANVGDRLSNAGYDLRCPGSNDASVPDGQTGTGEPRQTCALDGNGAQGTVWLGTAADRTVRLSALAS
ncbi:hypothetical protein FB565_008256 [Actinoplanes lutulentus]|uniref:Uncharacterized protein n=1 Tax=Actinoplanes lutulentus TaxID=1287878 RepID=A0A327Z7U5_9ACTN|nr:hypothetical protein [Actinoplanes lutulentus]MBB2948473.1 hypothetical protein [Actinoplanes lutulentus]RAK34495.1 hypothetical protein B0I29_11194 [Actinoplanes lutulentus]